MQPVSVVLLPREISSNAMIDVSGDLLLALITTSGYLRPSARQKRAEKKKKKKPWY
jgi:hypothetical protein